MFTIFFVLLILLLLGLIVLLLAPTLIEVRKPKDKGPRKIDEKTIKEARESKHGRVKVLKQILPENLQQILRELEGKEISAMGLDTIKIRGDVKFPKEIEITKGIVVEGSLIVGERCLFGSSLKASKNITVENGVIVKGDLVTDESAYLGANVVVEGSIHAQGSVWLGANTFVGGSIVAGENVELQQNSRVAKNIFSGGGILVRISP